MRAILIDPETESLMEIQIEGTIEEIKTFLRCRRFTGSGKALNGNIVDGFDSIYVSDDYLEDQDDPRYWFQVDADKAPPSSFPIAGLGLAHGTDSDGNMTDIKISLEDLIQRITFTQRKFRGFKATELPDGIAVEVVAPIIEKQ